MQNIINFDSIIEMLSHLSDEYYLVLRNFEAFDDNNFIDGHLDIDLLCVNVSSLVKKIGALPRTERDDKLHYYVIIENKKVDIDIRHVGDNYFDKKWEKAVLARRVLKNSYYVMDNTDYFYSLLYHALIHKGRIGDDYLIRLSEMADRLNIPFDPKNGIEILNKYLIEHNYKYTYPHAVTTPAYFDGVDKKLIAFSFVRFFRKLYQTLKRSIKRIFRGK